MIWATRRVERKGMDDKARYRQMLLWRGAVPVQRGAGRRARLLVQGLQYLSSGNASINAFFKPESFKLEGEVGEYVSKADSGTVKRRRFCPKCGTQLFSEAQNRDLIAVRVGALDDREVGGPV